MKYNQRALWNRRADTAEGEEVLKEARLLSRQPEYQNLSDTELIRLAYWGVSGEKQ